MTGDVFRGYLLDAFFNLAGTLTGQNILLVGMMTEAVVTPWLSDPNLALQNVRYVMNAAGSLADDFHPSPDGFIVQRARRCWERASSCWSGSSRTSQGGPAGSDRRRDLRPHEAPRQVAVVSTASPRRRPATTTPRPRSWRRHAMTSSGPTATPPATAWCRSRSRCRSLGGR